MQNFVELTHSEATEIQGGLNVAAIGAAAVAAAQAAAAAAVAVYEYFDD
jgi:hypothetical protein